MVTFHLSEHHASGVTSQKGTNFKGWLHVLLFAGHLEIFIKMILGWKANWRGKFI